MNETANFEPLEHPVDQSWKAWGLAKIVSRLLFEARKLSVANVFNEDYEEEVWKGPR